MATTSPDDSAATRRGRTLAVVAGQTPDRVVSTHWTHRSPGGGLAHLVQLVASMLQDHAPSQRVGFDPYPQPLVIADDSADMRWLVRMAVGEEFADVVEVTNGRELLWTLLRSTGGSAAPAWRPDEHPDEPSPPPGRQL